MRLLGTIVAVIAICSGQDQPGSVQGSVTDGAGTTVAGARVVVAAAGRVGGKCETTSDARGAFACALAAGRYHVTADAQDFLPYRRAVILVQPGQVARLTLQMPFTVSARVYVKGKKGFREETITGSPPKYEQQTLEPSGEVLVQYATVRRETGQLNFSGPSLALTLDTFAVYASQMVCTNPIRSCWATGIVVVESGDQRLEGTRLDIDLSTRKYTLTRETQVAGTF